MKIHTNGISIYFVTVVATAPLSRFQMYNRAFGILGLCEYGAELSLITFWNIFHSSLLSNSHLFKVDRSVLCNSYTFVLLSDLSASS